MATKAASRSSFFLYMASALLLSCIPASFAFSQISDSRIAQLISATRILAGQRALEEFAAECTRMKIPELTIVHALPSDSFLEFGSWVFSADPKLIARCDGYQVFVVYANGTDMLFLDESARPGTGTVPAAEQGMSFGEFNFYHADYDIESVSCEVISPDKVQVSGTASSVDDDSSFRFRIVADTAQRSYTYEDTKPK